MNFFTTKTWRADVKSHDVFTTVPILELQIYFSLEFLKLETEK